MADFEELARSRRDWIEQVLQPWCRRANLRDLRRAELDWPDIAGRVTPETTLWRWAWQRFPDLVHPDLGIDEAHAVRITLRDGAEIVGYPDSRRSQRGELVLVTVASQNHRSETRGPYSLDEVAAVERATPKP